MKPQAFFPVIMLRESPTEIQGLLVRCNQIPPSVVQRMNNKNKTMSASTGAVIQNTTY